MRRHFTGRSIPTLLAMMPMVLFQPSTDAVPTTTVAAIVTSAPSTATAQGLATPSPLPAATDAPTSPAPTTTTTVLAAPPGTRTKLRLDIAPRAATVIIRTSTVESTTTTAQATVTVPAGRVDLTIAAPGYQPRQETVTVTAAGGTITRRLDPIGQMHRHRFDIKTGSNPKQVAFTPDGAELWVPLLGSRGVDVFRTADGSKVTTIRIGNDHGAVEVIFNRAGTRAYVSQMETASVFEVDTASYRVLRRMATGGNWTKVLALSPEETTLYAANWVSNDVSVLSLATGTLLKRIPTVKTPRGLSFDPTGTRMFVAGFEGGEIQRINLVTGEKAILLHTGGAMRHMAVDEQLGVLYADDMGTNGVYVVDLSTEKVRQIATVDSHPNTIDLSPDRRFLYVSNRGENSVKGYNVPGPEWGSVLVVDVATGKILDAIIGGNQTTGLDVSPDGKLLAFTDFLDNRLAVYDIPSAGVLDAGNGGLAPRRRPLIVKRAG